VFLQAGDLRFGEIDEDGQRERELVGVMFEKGGVVDGDLLAQRETELVGDIVDDAETSLAAKFRLLRGRQLDEFGFDRLDSHPAFPEGDGIGDDAARAHARVLGLEFIAQFVEIQSDVVTRLIFGERDAVAIQDFAADRRDAHGAEGLGLLIFRVMPVGNHLHKPEPDEQRAHTRKHANRQHPQMRVALFKLVENEHG
jgi:hypothetical protein